MPKEPGQIPKYLELIYDKNEDEPKLASQYETPLPDLDDVMPNTNNNNNNDNSCNSSVLNVQNDKDKNSYNLELNNDINGIDHTKERTFSSSSTVSETSVCYPSQTQNIKSQPQPNNMHSSNIPANNNINNNNCSLAQKSGILTLPNSKQNCNSNDALLSRQKQNDKLRQLYANTHMDNVLNCDGITSM